ncbi:Peptidase M15 [Vibrio mediterranei]|uniref:YcbK family protein n=1 Tax=Vibrio mediterranei TaxID=689 RepID=UPI0007865C0D|nr:YcbK family protein [Vibrio mediterranei]SBO09356.1 Peptidase M15 [Vibrio mediterranei]
MIQTNISRRDALKLALCGATASLVPSLSFAMPSSAPRTLAMNNLHTGESLESRYFDGAKYIQSELARLNTLCRDHRRNETHNMDKRLFDQISEIQSLLGVKSEVLIISGYRSPETNASLRSGSNGVAKKSLHMLGQAIDFRLDGVKLSHLHEAALTIKAGGVGYYPRSQFVHIDTGPVRNW